ncbi:RNA polymerase sigma factor SigJ [Paenibacillus koleovorans]|uniref:RNA polymerase sigma factor SigJ n=1 Tax=Paenibacillus koleovorans TaxID=121608 RepID=UPI000FDC26F6|nr:RNA polymerase sigma factor SigJ [Paenibacillus koleovorans]
MQELFTQYNRLLFKLAYQLTGSVTDAEDVVQDVFLKVYDVPADKLTEPKAYLCKMVANRCRDLQKTARKKREQYYGEWLPEPFSSSDNDTMDAVVRDDLLSYGMLVLLERLTPSERIVFVLREALGFEYGEIARLTEKSEVNCRKVFSRATAKMGLDADDEPFIPSQTANREWVQGFIGALKQGNMDQILALLDQDVVSIADGGGKATAVLKPLVSKKKVAHFLLGALRKGALVDGEARFDLEMINGQPSFAVRSAEGLIHTVGLLQVEDNRIRHLFIIRNPDKLKHVGA